MLKQHEGMDQDSWASLLRVAFDLLKSEVDEDVRRFVTEVLILMEAPRNKMGDFEDPSELVGAVVGNDTLSRKVGDFKWRNYNPWRSALLRSLRNNKSINCKSMEMISSRINQTKINRTLSFRGFVPDSKDRNDQLYTVVDARIEKAEQNILASGASTEVRIVWNFKLTEERYEIEGRLSTIKANRGLQYNIWNSGKSPIAPEEDGLLHLRRIAWNACAEEERVAFRFPGAQDEAELFPAAEDKSRAVGLMRRALQALCMDPRTQELRDPAEAFRAVDKDGGGTLNVDEFVRGLREAKAPLTEADARALFEALDPAEGELEYAVFSDFMRRMPVPDNFWVQLHPHTHPLSARHCVLSSLIICHATLVPAL